MLTARRIDAFACCRSPVVDVEHKRMKPYVGEPKWKADARSPSWMRRVFAGKELRFSFNVAGCYVTVGGRTRLLRHHQIRRLFDEIV